MARPKSEDKQKAILTAALQVFAERGLDAPTSAISRAAAVAEGTLFTYFKTKDELVNALYRDIKGDLAEAMLAGFPRKAGVRERLQHVWDNFVEWGVTNPEAHRVLRQVQVWSGLTAASKSAGSAPFAEISAMAEAAAEQRIFRELPPEFFSATLNALAEVTMETIRQNPEQAEVCRRAGFEMLWAGITCRPGK